MRTDGVYRQEVTNRVYVREYKEREDKNTRTLRSNEKHIFGTSLSHNFLKNCHTRVCNTKIIDVN